MVLAWCRLGGLHKGILSHQQLHCGCISRQVGTLQGQNTDSYQLDTNILLPRLRGCCDGKTVTNLDDMITQMSAMQALAGAQLPLGHGRGAALQAL